MNDVTPPKRPLGQPAQPKQATPESPPPSPVPQKTAAPEPSGTKPLKPKRKGRKLLWWIVGGVIFLLIALVAGACFWYTNALRPVDESVTTKTRVTVAVGSTPVQIGELLKEKGLIRDVLAFDIYTRLSGTRNKLQAGSYSLSPSESTEKIVDHLVAGRADQFTITFIPGETLTEHRKRLIDAGYTAEEVDAAFKKRYDHPLFADKPASADLEGYIYGETYTFGVDATVEDILETTFDEFYKVIQENNLIAGFRQQEMNLYQGITMASIVQREDPRPNDQRQIAQVFLKRYHMGMPLGADPTYKYAAQKLGVAPTPQLDSPYNTRKYAGLPPGPIASPGKTALIAVANPAEGDYLYFLSGDDDVTYFAYTEEEHQQNIQNHCQIKCATY